MDLNEILKRSGVSNEVVKDAGAIKSDDKPVSRAKQTSQPKPYPLGINHARRMFYSVYAYGQVTSSLQCATFEEAKAIRDQSNASEKVGAIVVAVVEVDYI